MGVRPPEPPIFQSADEIRSGQTDLLIDAHGEINRRRNPTLFAGLNLRPHQIELKAWVHHSRLGGIIAHPMMALAKQCHPVDPRLSQSIAKDVGIEASADIRDFRSGVKVEMDLPEPA